MQPIAACNEEWICNSETARREDITGKVLDTVAGIVKDTLVLSVVVVMGVALTLLLG